MYARHLIRLAASAIIASGLSYGSTPVLASDYYPPKHHKSVEYKTIVVYETIQKPVLEWVIKYDHCDKPYRVQIVTYKTVRVPVTKRIPADY